MNKIFTKHLTVIISVLLLGFASNFAHAALWLVGPGLGDLRGANGVVVNGNIYNVRFSFDLTCEQIFNGCETFTFDNFADATAASSALADQVFVNAPFSEDLFVNPEIIDPIVREAYERVGLVFGSSPSATLGCSGGCAVFTPFGRPAILTSRRVDISLLSRGGRGTSVVQTAVEGSAFDEVIDDTLWVDWQFVGPVSGPGPGPVPVPEPSTVWLFCLALVGLFGLKAKAKRGSAR